MNSDTLPLQNQNRERNKLYTIIKEGTKQIANDPMKFKQYLDIQSSFGKYSVGNAILITTQKPNAVELKSKSDWNKAEVKIKKDEMPIMILEPDQTNGTVYYNAVERFDISQTSIDIQKTAKQYEEKELLKAFLYDCPVKIETVDVLSNGQKGVEFNKEDNRLCICRGLKMNDMLIGISQELSRIEIGKEEISKLEDFKSYCCAYMLCKKYDIDVSSFNLSNIPEEFKNKDEKGIKLELGTIKESMEAVNSRITEFFEVTSKKRIEKSHVR